MKKLLAAVLIAGSSFLATQSAEAVVLACGMIGDGDPNAQLGIKSEYMYDCSSTVAYQSDTHGTKFDSLKYQVYFTNRGLGAHLEGLGGFLLTCPSIKTRAMGTKTFNTKKNKTKKGVTELFGVSAQAAAMVGANVGVAVSKRGDICTITGLEAGFGFLLAGWKMEISRYKQYDSWERYDNHLRKQSKKYENRKN